VIYLPRAEQPEEPTVAAMGEPLPRGHGERVLLVEDEVAILQMGQRMLQALGYRVLCAATPQQALILVDGLAPPLDLLVTDVVMPGMNGQELAERLKAHYPRLSVLYVSGYTPEVFQQQGISLDTERLLPKPFTLAGLGEAMLEALAED